MISRSAHLIHVSQPISEEVQKLTGIHDGMLTHAATWAEIMPELDAIMSQCVFMVAYNADFDRRFLERAFSNENASMQQLPWVDPWVFVKEIDKYKKGKKLTDAARRWGINLNGAHRALADATATAELLFKMKKKIGNKTLANLMLEQKTLKEAQEKSFQAYLKRKQETQTQES